jgi:hypothetical protein
MAIEIKTEREFSNWFTRNFRKIGYEKILRKDCGFFPDFLMLKNGEEKRIELETLSSNFILHSHDKCLVDEVVCIVNDVDLGIPTFEVNELDFIGNKKRISATVEKGTKRLIEKILENNNFRNKSHVIEKAIERLAEKENGK